MTPKVACESEALRGSEPCYMYTGARFSVRIGDLSDHVVSNSSFIIPRISDPQPRF